MKTRIKKYNLNDLPLFSHWPSRLLGFEHWDIKYKTREAVTREYEEDKWGSLLKKINQKKDKVSIGFVDKIVMGNSVNNLCCLNEKLFLSSNIAFNKKYISLIKDSLEKFLPASAIVELGCGYGNIIIKLAKLRAFSYSEIMAAEFTPSGIELTKQIAEKEGLDIKVGYCDIDSDNITGLQVPQNAIIFTSYAMHYIPKIRDRFITAISNLKPKVVVHFEPCYEHCNTNSLLGLMRKKYIEFNDYNRNLVSLLHSHRKKGNIKIHIEQPAVLGSNPLLAISVIAWSPSKRKK